MGAQPDWYPSDSHPGRLRYWDGTRWTNQYQPDSASGKGDAYVAVRRQRRKWMIVSGVVIVLAVALILGIQTYNEQAASHRKAVAIGVCYDYLSLLQGISQGQYNDAEILAAVNQLVTDVGNDDAVLESRLALMRDPFGMKLAPAAQIVFASDQISDYCKNFGVDIPKSM